MFNINFTNPFKRKLEKGMETVEIDMKKAVMGGFFSFLIILIGGYLVGEASHAEAYHLFEMILPTTRALCRTLILALGTILALMLTLISLSVDLEHEIKWTHYVRVRQIAFIVTFTLIITFFTYLLLNIPITESDEASLEWFTYIYYATSGMASILGGLFITIVLLLYNTVRDMINFLNPETTYLLSVEEEEDENKGESKIIE